MSDFLKGFLADEDVIKASEMMQIGTHKNEAAVVLACMAYSDGWSTLYYLGVLPKFRGRGIGTETMLQDLLTLKKLGGKLITTEQALKIKRHSLFFGQIKALLFRGMEDWRLRLRKTP